VLTTLHTENAAAAVPRLLDLGVEDFLLRSTLRAVIAQRLVRRLCDRCKLKKQLGTADIDADPRYAALGFDVGAEVYAPAGCESCGGAGYRGRLGIFEVLELNHEVRSLIHGKTDAAMIDRVAIQSGMTTMLDDGAAKCLAGATSVAEVLRVTTVR
jgi:general secretion pathway protein E